MSHVLKPVSLHIRHLPPHLLVLGLIHPDVIGAAHDVQSLAEVLDQAPGLRPEV
eukprot:CAMPEP_0202914254 /NCGR_PEP_ID=MMETSP1392-20130828/62614_1 /ASSEMBLY_ACC=CAM_ASM_000868 /TAXON_ID=225041 /ORGANISM="Chlamydomonas chlamydogama, Strain SAG 11-48b" /LENGTH=53 /DNA_ID=CAMNT_0049605833 /DNA_START=292 /DNA_END=453 /DNA_ORIENTATION=+